MIIRKETLQAAMAATTADDTRYFLHAIHAEPAANRVVATNGHVLLIATDKAPYDDADFPTINGATFHGNPEQPVNIPVDVCKAMIGTMPKKATIPILQTVQLGANGSPSSAIVSATDLSAPKTATIDTTESKFPTYDRVFPKADRPVVSVNLGVEVLKVLIKAAEAINRKTPHKIVSIRFDVPIGRSDQEKTTEKDPETGEIKVGKPGDVCTAVSVTIGGLDVDITGVAMPCRR